MKKNLVIFFATLLIFPLFFLTSITYLLKFTLFNNSFLKNELSKQNIYEKVLTELPVIINEIEFEGDQGQKIKGLADQNPFIIAIGKSIKPYEAQKKVESAIDSILPWLLSEKDELYINIPLVDIKEKVFISIMEQFRENYNKARVCKPNEFNIEKLECRPEGLSYEDFLIMIFKKNNSEIHSTDDLKKGIPNYLTVDFIRKNPNLNQILINGQSLREKISIGLPILYLMPFLILILIISSSRIISKSWANILKYSGGILLNLGLLSISSMTIIQKIGFPKLVDLTNQKITNTSLVKDKILIPTATNLVGSISKYYFFLMLFVVAVAIIIFMSGFFMEKRNNTPK